MDQFNGSPEVILCGNCFANIWVKLILLPDVHPLDFLPYNTYIDVSIFAVWPHTDSNLQPETKF